MTRFDRLALVALMLLALVLAGRAWLADHPGDNPWAPLDLRDPPGWATRTKLAALKSDPAECRAVLRRSDVAFRSLDAIGAGACHRDDRTVLDGLPLTPPTPPATCALGAGLHLWVQDDVQPAALRAFGQRIATIEHFGTYSCRRINGSSQGSWSEHATGNAIDIAAFTLEDGSRIAVARDWAGEGAKPAFLREVRDAACRRFATVLSPEYNAAHADHLHLDQARAYSGYCR